MAGLLLWIICDIYVCVCHAFVSIHCCQGKGLTSWLLFVMLIVSVTFPFGILGQVWYLIESIPDPCCLSVCSYILRKVVNKHNSDASTSEINMPTSACLVLLTF